MNTDNERDFGWHSAIIMRGGHLSIESFFTKAEAIEHLRTWYAGVLAELEDPEDRAEHIAEFGHPTTATVEGMCNFYAAGEEHHWWCDVVPVECVLSRISPTLMDIHLATPHAAVVLTEGLVEAQPCQSYDQALATLRDRAGEWDLDPSDPDPTTASAEQLSTLYGGDEPGMWIGIMPLITTPYGPAVLVPIDRLSANI